MDIKKRISAFALALLLSFGVCATDYLEVQALEWAGVTIGLDTALKFLLGLVGVSVGVGVADEINWTETREQCIQFQQNQGNSAVAVSNWWADVIRGKLDTASECWYSFKNWVKNDLLSSGGGSVGYPIGLLSGSDIISTAPINLSYTNGNFLSRQYDNILLAVNSSGALVYFFCSYDMDIFFTTNNVNNNWFISGVVNSNSSYWYRSFSASSNPSFFSGNMSNVAIGNGSDTIYFLGKSVTEIPDFILPYPAGTVVPEDEVFSGAFAGVTDIGLGSSIATDLPSEGVLDIPWENVGASAEAVDTAIDTAIDNVQSGTWSLDQYWEYVQNITNVYAYDITNNYLLPNDGNNETTEDKVQENVNRSAFVLAGLEKVFPFCIPWDIYAFVNLLVADPVAPVIEYPVYNPVTDSEEIIIIDFSVWEQQVIIMRYIFDFLLIIGLLLLARSLIGAGGSD